MFDNLPKAPQLLSPPDTGKGQIRTKGSAADGPRYVLLLAHTPPPQSSLGICPSATAD